MASNVDQMGSAGWLQGELVNSYRRGGRRQVVKAVACGAAIRGFESPRSPFTFIEQAIKNAKGLKKQEPKLNAHVRRRDLNQNSFCD